MPGQRLAKVFYAKLNKYYFNKTSFWAFWQEIMYVSDMQRFRTICVPVAESRWVLSHKCGGGRMYLGCL